MRASGRAAGIPRPVARKCAKFGEPVYKTSQMTGSRQTDGEKKGALPPGPKADLTQQRLESDRRR